MKPKNIIGQVKIEESNSMYNPNTLSRIFIEKITTEIMKIIKEIDAQR